MSGQIFPSQIEQSEWIKPAVVQAIPDIRLTAADIHATNVQIVNMYLYPELLDTHDLKRSLAIALNTYPFLAGRLQKQSEQEQFIVCNNMGVKFSVGSTSICYHDMANLNEVHDGFGYDSTMTEDEPVLAVRLIAFEDQGCLLTVSLNHGLFDSNTFSSFMAVWAGVSPAKTFASFEREDIVKTYLNQSTPKQNKLIPSQATRIEPAAEYDACYLKFNREEVLNIKLASQCYSTNISLFSHLLSIYAGLADLLNKPTILNFNMITNPRGQIEPPLPENFFGNFPISTSIDLILHDTSVKAIASKIQNDVKQADYNLIVHEWLKYLDNKLNNNNDGENPFHSLGQASVCGLSLTYYDSLKVATFGKNRPARLLTNKSLLPNQPGIVILSMDPKTLDTEVLCNFPKVYLDKLRTSEWQNTLHRYCQNDYDPETDQLTQQGITRGIE